MNALVILSMILDAALLSSIDYLQTVLKKEACFYVATGITIAWLVVMSMPRVSSDDRSVSRSLVCAADSTASLSDFHDSYYWHSSYWCLIRNG